MSLVNDCRQNIFEGNCTKGDLSRRNIDTLDTYINEWPMIFLVACENINPGEELLIDYGSGYGEVMVENQHWQTCRKGLEEEIFNIVKKTKN